MLYYFRGALINCVARSCLQVRVLLIVALAMLFSLFKVSSCFWKETLQAKCLNLDSYRKHLCFALCPNGCMSYFIRVDATNDAVHELVAEPVQEPRAGEQQEVVVEHAPADLVNPADLQGKPRSITII